MRRRMGSAYDRLAEGSCQTSQSSARGDRPGKGSAFLADLLDDGGGGAVLHQAEHPYLAAVSLDDLRADHLLDAVIAALDQHVRTHLLEQRSGVSSAKLTTQSTAPSPASTAMRRSTELIGRPTPFRRVTEASSLTPTIRRSPWARACSR